jgi:ribosomal protein S18 acetylase RimI-like enzyme
MWVRLANDSDLEGIGGVDSVAGVDPDRSRTLVSQSIAQKGCWIAGREDLPEGYLVLLRQHFFGRDFVSLIAVKSSVRRQGLASALFGAAEVSATTRQLFTSTNQSNRPMQTLLEARGYQKAGVIDHLDIDDPEMVFVKYLN